MLQNYSIWVWYFKSDRFDFFFAEKITVPKLGKNSLGDPWWTKGGVDNLQFQSIFKSYFENIITFLNDISARNIIYQSII